MRLLLFVSSFLPLLFDKVAVFTCSIFNKGLIGNDLLGFYDILGTHTKFINKLCKLIVLMNLSEAKYIIRSILKDASDVSNVIRIKGSITKSLKPNAYGVG